VPLTANGDAEAVQAAVTASGMAGAPAPPINPFRHLAAVVYPDPSPWMCCRLCVAWCMMMTLLLFPVERGWSGWGESIKPYKTAFETQETR